MDSIVENRKIFHVAQAGEIDNFIRDRNAFADDYSAWWKSFLMYDRRNPRGTPNF